MEIWKRYLSFSRIKQIGVAVCLAHLLAIFAMTAHHFATRKLRPARPIAVRTLPPPKPASIPVSRADTKSASAPVAMQTAKPVSAPVKKATPKPEAKKTEPAKTAAKKPATPKPVPKKQEIAEEIPPTQNEALREIAKSLESLAAAAAAAPEFKPEKTALVLPKALALSQPKIATEFSDTPPTYEENLIAFLQNALDLPERGDVQIKLEIDRFGHLNECEILDARNSKNGEFLKKRLPELDYPCFNDFGITDLTQTFTIIFRNV